MDGDNLAGSVFPGGCAVYFFCILCSEFLVLCAVRSAHCGADFLNTSYCPVGDLKRASSACASATRNSMQTEMMINLTEQPYHLSDQLGHCQCPHATSGGSVCASPGQETSLLSYRQPWCFSLVNVCLLCTDSWLRQASVWFLEKLFWSESLAIERLQGSLQSLVEWESIITVSSHFLVQSSRSWRRWNTATAEWVFSCESWQLDVNLQYLLWSTRVKYMRLWFPFPVLWVTGIWRRSRAMKTVWSPINRTDSCTVTHWWMRFGLQQL